MIVTITSKSRKAPAHVCCVGKGQTRNSRVAKECTDCKRYRLFREIMDSGRMRVNTPCIPPPKGPKCDQRI